jgi:hypothetical protein
MRDKACGSGDGRSHFTAPTARAHAHCDRALCALGTDPHVGPTDVTLRACAAAQIGVFTCAIQSQAKRPRIRFKFRMFNTTKRAARRLLSAVPSGNGSGRQGPGASSSRDTDRIVQRPGRPAPSRRPCERPGTCTEARSGARPCGGESLRRGTDALSNFLTRYRTWLTYKRGWRVGGQA